MAITGQLRACLDRDENLLASNIMISTIVIEHSTTGLFKLFNRCCILPFSIRVSLKILHSM